MAAFSETYILLVVGMSVCGCGQAGNLAASYAGSDLATDENRAKSISLVVWANTVGAVLGPTVGLGLRSLAGSSEGGSGFVFSYLVSVTLFVVAAGAILKRLRPDPLLLVADASKVSIRGPRFSDLGLILGHPAARIALLGMMLSQGVMVGVMTVTPLHMRDGNQDPLVIGLMISMHIVGMYAFSPIVGRLVDRLGPHRLIVVGSLLLAVGADVAAHDEAHQSLSAFVGMFIVGIGWSCGLIASSALLVRTFDGPNRVGIQGLADMCMTTGGASAGIVAGLVLEVSTFPVLGHGAAVVGGLPAVAVLIRWWSKRRMASAL